MNLRLILLLCLASCALRDGEVPLNLSVHTTPPTDVFLEPPPGSSRQRVALGHTPLEDVTAFAGDTVVLQNTTLHIEYRETLEYGEPKSKRHIEKIFQRKP